MSYQSPIISEIYVELYLSQGTLTAPMFFDVVPALKNIGLDNIEFNEAMNVALPGTQIGISNSPPLRVRCWSSDKKHLAQLSPDLIILNLVGDYLGWDAFIELITKAYNAIKNVLGTVPLEVLSLNTIDRMEVPRDGYTLGKYLECGSTKIPEGLSGCSETCDLQLGWGVPNIDGHNRQLRLQVRLGEDVARIQFNSTFQEKLVPEINMFDLLDKIHDESNDSFESIITDETRKLMGGN